MFFQLHVAPRTYERLTGSRPDWMWEPEGRILYLATPSRDTRIMVLTSRRRHLHEISTGREADFLKAATARAKVILSRTLGSLGSIPGPAGPIETDARELRQEGIEEWRAVEDMLATAMSSWPPPRWIG